MPIDSLLPAPAGLLANPGYSHVVVASGPLAFVSGQIALDADGAVVGAGDMGAQTRQVLANVGAALDALGATWADVAKTTWFVTDVGLVQALRDERDRVLGPVLGDRPFPASTLVEVSSLVRPDLLVELDVVVAVPQA